MSCNVKVMWTSLTLNQMKLRGLCKCSTDLSGWEDSIHCAVSISDLPSKDHGGYRGDQFNYKMMLDL